MQQWREGALHARPVIMAHNFLSVNIYLYIYFVYRYLESEASEIHFFSSSVGVLAFSGYNEY